MWLQAVFVSVSLWQVCTYTHSHKETVQLLPEQWSPTDNASVGPLIFMMCELASEGTVEKDGISKTETWQTNE